MELGLIDRNSSVAQLVGAAAGLDHSQYYAAPATNIYPTGTLGAGEIRVLDIEASTSVARNEQEPLRGELRVVSLTNKEPFLALSYVWGKQRADSPQILIKTSPSCYTPLRISRNCYDGLVRVRDLRGRVTIWVDSICIDQSNVTERNKQIPLMGEIYTFAERVFVWLGPENCDFRELLQASGIRGNPATSLFDFLPLAASLARPESNWNELAIMAAAVKLSMKAYWASMSSAKNMIFHPYSSCTNGLTMDLDYFFNNIEWFQRAWCYQEIVLANHATLLMGNNPGLDWQQVVVGSSALQERQERRKQELQVDLLPRTELVKAKGHDVHQLVLVWMKLKRPTPWRRGKDWMLPAGTCFADFLEEGQTLLNERPCLRLWIEYLNPCIAITAPFWVPAVITSVPVVLKLTGDTQTTLLALPNMFMFLFWMIFACHHSGRLRPQFTMWKSASVTTDRSDSVKAVVYAIGLRKATDPKDRSYAMHGVLKRIGLDLSPADYRKDKVEIYNELFYDLLRWDPTLIGYLTQARGLRGLNPLKNGYNCLDDPSWSIYWDNSHRGPWVEAAATMVRPRSNSLLHVDRRNPKDIITKGIILGVTSHCTGAMPRLQATEVPDIQRDYDEVLIRALWRFAKCTMAARKQRIAEKKLYHALCGPLLPEWTLGNIIGPPVGGGRGFYEVSYTRKRAPSPNMFAEHFVPWCQILRSINQSSNNGDTGRRQLKEMLGVISGKEKETLILGATRWCQHLDGRSIFLTDTGLAGIGEPGTSVGHTVASLDGMSVPMILAHAGSNQYITKYRVVGPAFISNLKELLQASPQSSSMMLV